MTCSACPENSVSVRGNTACACREGFSGSLSGATGSCQACGPNKYQSQLRPISTCSSCPALSATLLGVTIAPDVTSCKCVPGTFQDADGVCTPVPAGSYGDVPGLLRPVPCPPGTISTEPGATSCLSCPLSSSGIRGGTACACVPGYAGALDGISGKCSPCPKDTYQPLSDRIAASCLACPEFATTQQGLTAAPTIELCLCAPGMVTLPNNTCAPTPAVRPSRIRLFSLRRHLQLRTAPCGCVFAAPHCAPSSARPLRCTGVLHACSRHAHAAQVLEHRSDGRHRQRRLHVVPSRKLGHLGHAGEGGLAPLSTHGLVRLALSPACGCQSLRHGSLSISLMCPLLHPSPTSRLFCEQCACNSGYFGSLDGAQGACDPCPPNQYQNSGTDPQARCMDCTPNSATLPGVMAASSSDLCLCDPGFYTLSDGTCSPVPPVRCTRNCLCWAHPWIASGRGDGCSEDCAVRVLFQGLNNASCHAIAFCCLLPSGFLF